jgi:P-type Ca2+ transporter type 2C
MIKKEIAWHTLPLAKIFKINNSSKEGLSNSEVKKKLNKFGFNLLAQASKFSLVNLFLSQFRSTLIIVLIVAGFISIFFGEYVDAYVIFAAVFINVIVGFIQEFKANKSLEKLNKIVRQETLVFRDGIEKKIESKLLVPGDIIVLESGNRVPADARLVEINDFEVNEATLTGESWPVKKALNNLDVGTVLAERVNMVFMGTLVVEGRARAIIVSTGFNTEMGKITVMLKETKEAKTPLQQKLDSFAKTITKIIALLALAVFAFGVFKGHEVVEMFTLAVAIAVSAIPEGLVISMTMILTVGMQRILKHKGLVRRLVSAETLGSTTVICTDKTGTLTEGEMRVTNIVTNKFQLDLSTNTLRDLEANEEITLITEIAFFCNDAAVQNPEASGEDWVVLGSPTEKALMIFGSNDPDIEDDRKKMQRVEEITFDHSRKFMITRHHYDAKYDIVFIKGAPERILAYSNRYLRDNKPVKMTGVRHDYFDNQWQVLSKQGLRVLAGAYQLIPKNYEKFDSFKDNPRDFIFAGIWGLSDPLRKETKQTLKSTLKAGINTVIITGDNKFTAQKIGKDLGLVFKNDNVVTGDELLKMTDEELKKRVKDIKVYARVSPSDKLRIIKAWQSRGEVVSMTGDGVNDAPALKAADIGVAVSSGSDVAKETADLVLLDNNFGTIVMAIKQGRVIFANLRKVILYLLSDSFSEIIIIVGSLILQIPLPLLAAQILWVNLVDDGFPALALTMEPEDEKIMNQKPGKMKELLDFESKFMIGIVSTITGLSSLGLFWYFWKSTGDEDLARTVTFTTLAITTLFYVFSIKSLEHNIFKSKPFKNKYLNGAVLIGLLTQLVAIYTPFLNRMLRTVPLGWKEWEIILASILVVIILIEITKAVFIYYQKKKK